MISVLTNFIKECIYPNALYTFLRSKFGTLQNNIEWKSLEYDLKLSNVLILPTNSALLFQAKIYGKMNISIADPARLWAVLKVFLLCSRTKLTLQHFYLPLIKHALVLLYILELLTCSKKDDLIFTVLSKVTELDINILLLTAYFWMWHWDDTLNIDFCLTNLKRTNLTQCLARKCCKCIIYGHFWMIQSYSKL